MINIFVYGTLKPSEKNYAICASHVVVSQPALTDGRLYELPLGYPAMTLEAGTVYGTVLSFANASILQILDAYERHDPEEFYTHAPHQCLEQNEYDRQSIAVYDQTRQCLGNAWSYLMTEAQIQRLGGILLPDGQWHQPQDSRANVPLLSLRQESSYS